MNNYTFTTVLLIITLIFLQCSEASRKQRRLKIKQQQYYIEGQQLYTQNCSSCHQPDGSGLGKLIPPISATFIDKNLNLVVCGVKHGIEGPLQIGEVLFNNKMPSNSRLSNLQIAEIMTFIQSKWGEKDTMISIDVVDKALSSCNKGY